ncbi:hypothetical protein pZL12.104c [Streptomyces phage ZL12]|uniref:Uncharacterized protein n=1 Tax=Streptomyces phage ZL12 TaxID=2570911 RepID=D0UWK9_9CAUD|nr:hypothetical protein QEH43_gp104 [Streptomyces phage ZL12]ACX71181.1 hypothetical protein pZL12.104c [Streptomyces phage ZL12]
MPKNETTFPFPVDLLDAQEALHQARRTAEEYASTLPWSAEPMTGWDSEKQLHSSYRSSKADSPGYTDEQRTEMARLRAEVLRLSEVVYVHPFWATVEAGKVVEARMRLKHAHEPAATNEA